MGEGRSGQADPRWGVRTWAASSKSKAWKLRRLLPQDQKPVLTCQEGCIQWPAMRTQPLAAYFLAFIVSSIGSPDSVVLGLVW